MKYLSSLPLQEFIQNATLAGGVAVGTAGNMPLQPWGALLMGTLAAVISVSGFRFVSVCTDKSLGQIVQSKRSR